MDLRLRDAIKDWSKEAGVLYVLVVVFVGLCFLCKSAQILISCNPTCNPVLGEPPKYYGHTP